MVSSSFLTAQDTCFANEVKSHLDVFSQVKSCLHVWSVIKPLMSIEISWGAWNNGNSLALSSEISINLLGKGPGQHFTSPNLSNQGWEPPGYGQQRLLKESIYNISAPTTFNEGFWLKVMRWRKLVKVFLFRRLTRSMCGCFLGNLKNYNSYTTSL